MMTVLAEQAVTLGTRAVRVNRKTVEAEGICSFELVDAVGGPLPSFEAGAHIDVHLPGGLVRQYSLCNAPRETHRYCIAVLQEPASRGGSRAMHRDVGVGDLLTIGGPRNHFALAPQGRHALLLAGGIGITPILSMAEALHAQGTGFDLHYSARSSARMAFADRLRSAPYAASVRLHLDEAGSDEALDLGRLLLSTPQHTHLYVCGPTGFIDAALSTAERNGWDSHRVHREFFAAPQTNQATKETVFEVELARSGARVVVESGMSIVRALERAGVVVPVSCEQGVCGTCLTRVLEGIPDHRDAYLTPEERAAGDHLLPCCSRALGPRIVLDL
jgi:vanillate O-demethylase ferredoxin subunit